MNDAEHGTDTTHVHCALQPGARARTTPAAPRRYRTTHLQQRDAAANERDAKHQGGRRKIHIDHGQRRQRARLLHGAALSAAAVVVVLRAAHWRQLRDARPAAPRRCAHACRGCHTEHVQPKVAGSAQAWLLQRPAGHHLDSSSGVR
jgi:hypothetical protein